MPVPRKGEKRRAFISRCVPQVIREGKEPSQANAICHSLFSNRKKDAANLDDTNTARECFEYHRNKETMFFSGTSKEFILDLGNSDHQKLLEEHCLSGLHSPEVRVEEHVTRAKELGIKRLLHGVWVFPDALFYTEYERLPLQSGWWYDGISHEFVNFRRPERIPAKSGFTSATKGSVLVEIISIEVHLFFAILNGQVQNLGPEMPVVRTLPLRISDMRTYAFLDETLGENSPMRASTFESRDLALAKQLAREKIFAESITEAILGRPFRNMQGTILYEATDRFRLVKVNPFDIA